jgi:hypothetical protein
MVVDEIDCSLIVVMEENNLFRFWCAPNNAPVQKVVK